MFRVAAPVIVILVVLDQLSKWAVLNAPGTRLGITVTEFFNLILVYNRGISFGLLDSSHPYTPWLLTGFNLLVVLFLIYWMRGEHRSGCVVALAMIIGGAFGNIVDRIRYGAVVDFLDFHLGGLHFPTFNVADIAITLGVALLMLLTFFSAKASD